MDNNQKQRLEKNLTRSAKKAKQYDVRGLIGHVESDQGFFSIYNIPMLNPLQNKETLLEDFIEDVGKLNQRNSDLEAQHKQDVKDLNDYKIQQIELQKENKKKLEDLEDRLKNLESFRID